MGKERSCKRSKIVKYWLKDLIKIFGKQDLSYYLNRCWKCKEKCDCIERAHIIPKRDGGKNKCFNLHLLCRKCHMESEWITNYKEYMNWFRNKN